MDDSKTRDISNAGLSKKIGIQRYIPEPLFPFDLHVTIEDMRCIGPAPEP